MSAFKDLGSFIREQRSTAQISLRQLAAAAGVSNPYLSQIERGLRKPSAEILQQIAKGLRISAEALYVQAGMLDERVGDPDVAGAIVRDSRLSERQKHVLLEIYESFVRESAETQRVAAQSRMAEEMAAATRPAAGHPQAGPVAADGFARAPQPEPDVATGPANGATSGMPTGAAAAARRKRAEKAAKTEKAAKARKVTKPDRVTKPDSATRPDSATKSGSARPAKAAKRAAKRSAAGAPRRAPAAPSAPAAGEQAAHGDTPVDNNTTARDTTARDTTARDTTARNEETA